MPPGTTPEVPREQRERDASALSGTINTLANSNATVEQIQDLANGGLLRRLQTSHRYIREHLGETELRNLRSLHRNMDRYIQEVQRNTNLSSIRQKELVAELTELRTELAPTVFRPGEFVQTQTENVREFARNNPGAVTTIAAVGVVALTGTLIASLWSAVSHSGQTTQRAGEAWSTFWKGILLTGVATTAAGVAAYFGWPKLQDIIEKNRKQAEQNQKTVKENQGIQKAQGVTDAAIKQMQPAIKQLQLTVPTTVDAARIAIDAARTSLDTEEATTRAASFMAEVGNARRKQVSDRWTTLRKQIADAQALLPAPPAPTPQEQKVTKENAPPPASQPDVKGQAGQPNQKLDAAGNPINPVPTPTPTQNPPPVDNNQVPRPNPEQQQPPSLSEKMRKIAYGLPQGPLLRPDAPKHRVGNIEFVFGPRHLYIIRDGYPRPQRVEFGMSYTGIPGFKTINLSDASRSGDNIIFDVPWILRKPLGGNPTLPIGNINMVEFIPALTHFSSTTTPYTTDRPHTTAGGTRLGTIYFRVRLIPS